MSQELWATELLGHVSKGNIPSVNRIDTIFANLRAGNRKALMPFVVAGFPSPHMLAATLQSLQKAGSSIVEIGIPFSDPIADGPVIAQAMNQALQQGATPSAILQEVAAIRATLLDTPGVSGVHDVRTRKMGDMIVVDAHLEVDVWPGRVPGVAGVRDRLSLRDLLAHR